LGEKIDMNEKILHQVIDQDLLEAQPDEWGITIHCSDSKSVGYATTLTPSVIHQAAESNLELLVTHHDTWEFMLDERDASHQLLAQYQISHIWCHEPLDKVDFGTAATLLNIIGRKVNVKIADDFGLVGELPKEIELARIMEMLFGQMSERPCRIHNTGKPISRIACVPGAGNMIEYLAEGLEKRIDLYITGETSLYLLEYAKYRGVSVLIYSHNYTEIFGTYNLARKIADHFEIDEVVRLEEPHY
jgi:putative NIF3 family GTP cyclohydrolase 1 type 2